jgi:signal peptidase II
VFVDKTDPVVLKARALALAVGVIIFALDIVSKLWVKNTGWLWYYPVIEGIFTIQYQTNEGVAFGFFHDLEATWKAPLLSLMAVVALLLVFYYIWTTPPREKVVYWALGLLLGGILGNFVDRLMDRSVVDFIKIHWGSRLAWPTFNVADSAITSGVFLILIATAFGLYSEPPKGNQSVDQ